MVYRFFQEESTGDRQRFKREDADVWIVRHANLGWIVTDQSLENVLGIPWGIAEPQQSAGEPPAGVWVSKKDDRSYVYKLRFVDETVAT